MNVLTILRSVEELLYEVMSWLLFYPLTLWMTLRRPLRTMEYSDREQRDKPDKQYLETLSPPLFLVLSILLAHAVEIAFGLQFAGGRSAIGRFVTENDQTLLGFRALVFSLPGLLFAWLSLRLTRKHVDRESLRTPFFAQCYLSGTMAILTSLGTSGIRVASEVATFVGATVVVAVLLWYLRVQSSWLRKQTGLRAIPAAGVAVLTLMVSFAFALGASLLIS